MNIAKTLITAASIAALSTSAMAGGLADEITEAPVEVMVADEPAGSSINPTFVVLGVLAALLLASALDDDEEEEDTDLILTAR